MKKSVMVAPVRWFMGAVVLSLSLLGSSSVFAESVKKNKKEGELSCATEEDVALQTNLMSSITESCSQLGGSGKCKKSEDGTLECDYICNKLSAEELKLQMELVNKVIGSLGSLSAFSGGDGVVELGKALESLGGGNVKVKVKTTTTEDSLDGEDHASEQGISEGEAEQEKK